MDKSRSMVLTAIGDTQARSVRARNIVNYSEEACDGYMTEPDWEDEGCGSDASEAVTPEFDGSQVNRRHRQPARPRDGPLTATNAEAADWEKVWGYVCNPSSGRHCTWQKGLRASQRECPSARDRMRGSEAIFRIFGVHVGRADRGCMMETALLMKDCYVADQPLLGCFSMVKYRV
jgi:hypothetical protein